MQIKNQLLHNINNYHQDNLLQKPSYDEIPRQPRNTQFQKSDPFRGGQDINVPQQKQQKQRSNDDLFGGNYFNIGRRAPVPGYQQYADDLKIQDQRVHVHTKRIEQNVYEEKRPTRRYIPEPKYQNIERPTGKKHVQPMEHIEPEMCPRPHPHYIPSDIYRSTEGVPKVTQAMKNYKPPYNYTQIGENEKIWQPRTQHKLWESHKDTIVGVQYPMDLTKQPVSIDNRKCTIDQKLVEQQLLENRQLANKYKQRSFE